MKPVDTFIVEFKEQFRGEIEVDGVKLLLSSIFNDSKQLTKYGKVYFNPVVDPGFRVDPGEYVWFHHNIARNQIVRGPSGEKVMVSKYMIDRSEDLYSIPTELIYAYTKNGELITPAPYCFVKPMLAPVAETKDGEMWLPGDELASMNTEVKYIKNTGIVECSNLNLEKKGIFKGDTVLFEKDSEYEMINVHGSIAYRMREDWIYAKHEN